MRWKRFEVEVVDRRQDVLIDGGTMATCSFVACKDLILQDYSLCVVDDLMI
jgi:hypothetical protein